MNILITGGCGFIGTNLIKKLYSEGGHYIRIIDNLSVGTQKDLEVVCKFNQINTTDIKTPDNGASGVELIVGDVCNESLAVSVSQGMDVIVHLAANTGVGPSVENPRSDCVTNVMGTLNYLEAARHNKVERFVFASSGAPVGECTPPIHEEIAPHPVSPYGASKLAGEGYCSAYWRSFGVKTIALRFGNVYGPLSKHKSSVVAKFIKQAIDGETLEIYGDGKQTRDFVYIGDLINAITLAANAPGDIAGEVFQIATYKETTVNEIAEALKELIEKETGKTVKIVHGSSRLGDVKRNFSDISKARKILGFEPKYNLTDGLRETLNYFVGK